MASDIDIANLALAHLGDEANVSSLDPPEGSPQAEHCARFYPIARDSALEAHAWAFGTTTEALTPLDLEVDGWDYAYALPNGCLAPLKVYGPAGRHSLDKEPFEIESDADGQAILLTNVEDAILRFTRFVEDTTKFSPGFVEAVAWLLASMLAGPLLKGESGEKAAISCYKMFQVRIGMAQVNDARRGSTRLNHTPIWIESR